ncbi:MAG: M17 family peptidase N-terminal domain-containing protein, partial [Pseudohongiellaceae bacterium]
MKFSSKSAELSRISTSCMVLGVHEKSILSDAATEADKACNGAIENIVKQGDLKGKIGQFLLLHNVPGLKAKRILLVGCGSKKKLTAKKFVSIVRHAINALEKYSLPDALLTLSMLDFNDHDAADKAKLIAQTAVTAQYHYSTTKSGAAPAAKLKAVVVYVRDRSEQAKARAGLELGKALGKGINTARELGNLPANICTPAYLA